MDWSRLNLVHPTDPTTAPSRKSVIDVEVTLKKQKEELLLKVDFRVTAAALNVNKKLLKDASQDGLWNWDVVEIFLASQGSQGKRATYYEFQVSPLGQFFELEIFEPRKRVNPDFKSGIQVNAVIESETPALWDATLYIPLAPIGHKPGNEIIGNICACLGTEKKREYYSAFLPPQERPDFHLPQYFQKLI